MSDEESGREEKFFHEILDRADIDVLRDPKVLTGFEKIDRDGIHTILNADEVEFFDEDGNLRENLLIKWNNLIALYSLRQRLAGKVKLIYIDPPYNTGSDGFRYNDSFNHSTWLVFMRNRLEIARELLSEDWIIMVQCDDNEQAYLKILMDEVFQRENFINNIVVKMSPEWGMKTTHKEKTIIKVKEYVLVYAKNNDLITLMPQYIERTEYNAEYEWIVENKEELPSKWKISRLYEFLNTNYWLEIKSDLSNLNIKDPEIKKLLTELSDKIWYRTRLPEWLAEKLADRFNEVIEYQEWNYGYKWRRMSFLSKTLQPIRKNGKIENTFVTILGDLYTDISIYKIFNQWWVDFKNWKKPEDLIWRLIALVTNERDIVLDFHLWSWTTSAVAHKMWRKWIGIEQMDYIESLAKKRLYNVRV
jgi:adenine-specific DNA-methyltransferase